MCSKCFSDNVGGRAVPQLSPSECSEPHGVKFHWGQSDLSQSERKGDLILIVRGNCV